MKKTATFRNHLIITIFAVATVSPHSADGKSVKDMFAEVSSSIVVVLTFDAGGRRTGQGSGVVVGKNEVVTNCHVVSNTRTIAVRQAADVRGRETYRMKAELVARNEQRDLCLLSVKELSAPPAAPPVIFAAARNVSIGEEVYAIGAPQGLDLSLSRGIISQLRGNYGKQSAPIIQTDAAISPGSSGGGLFNENGELLGITTFKFSDGASEGLSFALPVEWVKDLVFKVQKRKKCFSLPTVGCLFDEALRITKDIEIGTDSLKLVNATLCTIASAQAEVGNKAGAMTTLTDAIHVVERIDNARERDKGFSDIAAVQIEAGDIVGATQVAGRINNPIERASTLNQIATVQIKAGDNTRAGLTLETAVQLLEKFKKSIAQPELKANTPTKSWAEVSREMLKSLDVVNLPNSIRSIAKTQAMAGHITEALQTVGKIDDGDDFFLAYRVSGFLDIATVQIEAGDTAGAKMTLTDAIRAAEKLDDARTRDWKFIDIATTQAKAGDVIGAMQTARKINDSSKRVSTLDKIAIPQAQLGDEMSVKVSLPEALHAAMRIDDEEKRARRFIEIATAQAQEGNEIGAKATFADAIQIVGEINDRNRPPFGILLSPKEQNTFDALSTAMSRISVLRDIAVAQADAGDIKGALDTALNLSHDVIIEDRFLLESLESEMKAKRAVALGRIAVALSRIQ